MKKQVFCILLVCFMMCQTVFGAESDSNTTIHNVSGGANGSGVRIAIIDTGISTNAISSERIAEGKNYITSSKDTDDKIGHGTAMAGILVGMETKDLAGVVPDATLVPLVYYSKDDSGNDVNGGITMMAKAIRDAVDIYKCQVILISSGALENSSELQSAIEHAEKKKAVVVSSVGNEFEDHPEYVYYPAAYETVLGVGALREDAAIATFSQENSSVDLCAPGTDLMVATIRGKTIKAYGTSYAAAYVAGGAAQLLSTYRSLQPEQVRQALCNTAKDICEKGRDDESGYGVLQVQEALAAAKPMDDQNREQAAKTQKIRIIVVCISTVILLSFGGVVFIIYKRRKLRRYACSFKRKGN